MKLVRKRQSEMVLAVTLAPAPNKVVVQLIKAERERERSTREVRPAPVELGEVKEQLRKREEEMRDVEAR